MPRGTFSLEMPEGRKQTLLRHPRSAAGLEANANKHRVLTVHISLIVVNTELTILTEG
ncbi:protein of unknown function [Nitratireductor aquimarinus]